jgi:hypothetical protein
MVFTESGGSPLPIQMLSIHASRFGADAPSVMLSITKESTTEGS